MTPKDLERQYLPADPLPLRLPPPVLTTWYEHARSLNVWRLSRGSHYVEAYISDEELESALYVPALVHATISTLCEKWHKEFGEQLVPEPPPAEAQPWSVRYDNVIEGELIETEGKAIDAQRKGIEGR